MARQREWGRDHLGDEVDYQEIDLVRAYTDIEWESMDKTEGPDGLARTFRMYEDTELEQEGFFA